MIWLLKWVWFGHSHKWKIIDTIPKDCLHGDGKYRVFANVMVLQCEHCGDVSSREVR